MPSKFFYNLFCGTAHTVNTFPERIMVINRGSNVFRIERKLLSMCIVTKIAMRFKDSNIIELHDDNMEMAYPNYFPC